MISPISSVCYIILYTSKIIGELFPEIDSLRKQSNHCPPLSTQKMMNLEENVALSSKFKGS